ncbi:MAG: ATP-binding protein [Vicinamibacterales bacterium]|nr:ATP-binding protein [Vicinamibacterales bacterium]
MSIRSRIFAVIGVVVAAALVQVLLVDYFEGQRTEATNKLVVSLDRLDNQTQLGRLIIQMDSAMRSYALSGDVSFREQYERAFSDYERTVTVLPQSIGDTDQVARLTLLDEAVRDWHQNAADIVMTRRAVGDVTLAEFAELSDGRMAKVQGRLSQFESLARNRFNVQRDTATSTSLMATLFMLAVPSLAVVMLLMLVFLLARIVLDPLATIAQSARQISGGNFDVQLPESRRDELGALIDAFKDMTGAVQRRQRELTDALAREREVSRLNATLRTKAEQEHARLLATVATVPAALVILDASTGRIVLQNLAADALIGREPDDEDDRQAYWDRFHATTRDGTPCQTQDWGPARALRGELVVGQELIIEQADGRRIPILVSAAPLRDDRGTITGAVGAFQDITNLYEVDRLKTEFVSIVSHELRTPLTSIKGALQLIQAEANWEDPDHGTLIDVALSNTDRLVRIINDILDISKIEAGKLELNVRPFDAAELVRLSTQAVESIAVGASVTISPVFPAEVPRVVADPDRSVQALVNLLSNALKYAPPRSVVVVEVSRDGDTHLRFSVSDGGRGIPADKLDQLFKKFQQVDGADTRKFRGTGLGLAITKALIEMQGGTVAVESVVGTGSTFSLTIPVCRT